MTADGDSGEDAGMGNVTRIVVLNGCALALAACIPPKGAPVEPFTIARAPADDDSLRRAAAAMVVIGLEPRTETGSAFGALSPVTTDWALTDGYRTRWLVHVRDGEILVTSVCFVEVERRIEDKHGVTVRKETVPCEKQPVGLSDVAARIVRMVGWKNPAPSAPVAPPDLP